ncbi:unnamed protein product [Calypogeia fissa]
MGRRFFLLVLLVLALAVACQSGPSTSAANEFDGGGGVTCVKRPPVNVFFWEELEKILDEDLDETRDRDEDDCNRMYILQGKTADYKHYETAAIKITNQGKGVSSWAERKEAVHAGKEIKSRCCLHHVDDKTPTPKASGSQTQQSGSQKLIYPKTRTRPGGWKSSPGR